MKIKICGLFRNQDTEYANIAKPDYIGFVFAESRRKVTPEKASELKRFLNPDIKSVGVFVNQNKSLIAELVRNKIIDIIQLHGSEDNAYISELRELTGDTPIIKAVSVKSTEDILKSAEYISDFILLDNGKGGTGEKFDWNLIEKNHRIFLAGGVNPDNISEAIKLNPYCIDVSSGAETNGLKDKDKMIQLVRAVRNNGGIL